MKAFIQIALAAGHVYELPTEVIAQHRAKTMQELHPREFKTIDEAMSDTRELFAYDSEISYWARNNMNPSDYLHAARLVRYTPPIQDFANATWSHSDQPAIIAELDGAAIMQQPVEAVLTAMAVSNQLVNVTVLNNDAGEAFAAMALMIGNEQVIGTFAKALEITANHLATPATTTETTN